MPIISRSCCTSPIPPASRGWKARSRTRATLRAAPRRSRAVTGTCTAPSSHWAWMDGGPMKAMRSIRPAAWSAIACIGKRRSSTVPMSGLTRCTATPMPACSATRRSCGRATSIRNGRRSANHVPNAVNTALSGIPYWGTDIGGFVPTAEYDGELYVRWFQFGAFSPLFRSHGRIWPLHLPWGWNRGPAQQGDHG